MDDKELKEKVRAMNMEEKIEFITITTLGALKDILVENKSTDREATLILHFFITKFVKNGWKEPFWFLADMDTFSKG